MSCGCMRLRAVRVAVSGERSFRQSGHVLWLDEIASAS